MAEFHGGQPKGSPERSRTFLPLGEKRQEQLHFSVIEKQGRLMLRLVQDRGVSLWIKQEDCIGTQLSPEFSREPVLRKKPAGLLVEPSFPGNL